MKQLLTIAIGVALGIAGYMVVNEYCTSHSATVKIQGTKGIAYHGYDDGSQYGTTSSWDNKSIKQAGEDAKQEDNL